MKNLKIGLLFFVFAAFVGNQSMLGQNKVKDGKQSAQTVELNEKAKKGKENMIQRMEKKIKEASPEDRVKLEAKLQAYKDKYGDIERVVDNESAEYERRSHTGFQSNLSTAETENKLHAGKEKINAAKRKLKEDYLNGNITKDEVVIRKQKITAAEKQLEEAYAALYKKNKLLELNKKQ